MFIIDAHEDLAYNILTFGRDYTRSARQTRQLEAGTQTPSRNGDTLLGWQEYQQGKVAVVFSTLFAAPSRRQSDEWDTQTYRDFQEAHILYRGQLDQYHRLADDHDDLFRLVLNQQDLRTVTGAWEQNEVDESDTKEYTAETGKAVGLVILMEGAEGVRHPDELEEWWQLGVRIIGPAWAGTRFCGGTRQPGPLTKEGFALLEGMADLGFGLDISHMDETAVLQAFDAFPGVILATHANAWALLRTDSNRHLSDRVIQGLLERDGVIGVVPYNAFLKNDWRSGDRREGVSIQRVVAQIDYICQMAGDAAHVGLGTDFDGGFGLQSVPLELDTIADVRKLIPLLAEKGYTEEDISAILGLNWAGMLQKILPLNS